jgi:hypothetical protein
MMKPFEILEQGRRGHSEQPARGLQFGVAGQTENPRDVLESLERLASSFHRCQEGSVRTKLSQT